MLEAVGREGYEGTSVRIVLGRSGLYRQAFYDNFEDKEDCYLQAYDAAVERVEAGVRAAASTQGSWLGELRAGLGTLLDFLDTEPDVGRALIVEVHPAGEVALAKREEAMRRARGFLDRARVAVDGAGSAPQIAPEAVAAGILAVVHSRLAAGATSGFRELLPEFMYVSVLPFCGPVVARAEMDSSQL